MAGKVVLQQPMRNTCIFRRMHPPKLPRKGFEKLPFRASLKRREYVYILEENTNCQPQGNMQILLTEDVEGVGLTGDLVEVKKSLARNHLLPNRAAVYASPENLEKYTEISQKLAADTRQSLSAQKTLRQLSGLELPVPMHPLNPWILNTQHLRVAFRLAGVEVPEHCISLPEEPVTKPGVTDVKVRINKLDVATIKAVVYHQQKPVGEEDMILPKWTAADVPYGTILTHENLKQ